MSRKKKFAIMGSGGETSVYDRIAAQLIANLNPNQNDITIIRKGFRGAFDRDILSVEAPNAESQPGTTTSLEKLQCSKAAAIIKGCRDYNAFEHEGHTEKIAEFLATFEAVFVIGGDGSMGQCYDFIQAYPYLNLIGLPGTMDGAALTDITLGEATAAKAIRDEAIASFYSAFSLDRIAVTEGMGRNCGEPVVDAAIQLNLLGLPLAAVLTPQYRFNLSKLTNRIVSTKGIVLVSEGISIPGRDTSDNSVGSHKLMRGAANELAELLKPELRKSHLDIKSTTTGYAQRAGEPQDADLFNSSLMAKVAVQKVKNGEENIVIIGKQSAYTPAEVVLRENEVQSVSIERFVLENRRANKTSNVKYHPRQEFNLDHLKKLGVYVGAKIC